MSLLDALLLDPAPFNIWIADRSSDQQKGSGTISDPFRGDGGRLDDILKSLPNNTRVHLGPGTFDTAGYREGTTGSDWWPRPGMKIVGSGVGVTTLRISSPSAASHYIAIGRSRLDLLDTSQGSNMEISDLTIDCAFPSGSTVKSCAAIQVTGTHVRVRNVFAKNWGNRDTTRRAVISVTTFAAKKNGTLVAQTTADPVIEDCIVADASTNYIALASADDGQMVALEAGGFADSVTNIQGFGLAPVIRNCFVEGKVDSNKKPLSNPKIQGVAMELCYGGIVEGNQFHNLWIGGPRPTTTDKPTRELIVRNNTYKNVVGGVVFGNQARWGAAVDNQSVSYDTGTGELTVTISSPHQLFVGIRVKLEGLSLTPDTHQIIAVTSTTFKVKTNQAHTGGPGTFRIVYALAKVVVENNYLELAAFTSSDGGISVLDGGNKPIGVLCSANAAPPGYAYGEVLIRANKFRYFNGQSDSNFTGTAIQVASIEKGMIRDNYIETVPANPLQIWDCAAFGFLNNRKPDGTLVLGLNNTTGEKSDEIQTEAEDALVLAMFNRR